MSEEESMKSNGYMLDTTVFNRVLDNDLDSLDFFYKVRCFVTYIQATEINNTSCKQRRDQLWELFNEIKADDLPLESTR